MRKSNHPVKSSLCFCVCLHLFLLLLNFPSNGVSLSQTVARHLPGFDGPLPFELETGYVSVDESDGVELFYYFAKSENNPKDDPLILWMTGGPGCSALSGLAFEIGPFSVRKVVYNGSLPTLVLNPYSWTKVSNIISVDSPVGTGFTYSKTLRGSHSSDKKSAKHTKIFITKWLDRHPEFLRNPFYVGGDSYSGITIPIVVQEISDGIAAGHKPWINLKGYFLGNPITDRDTGGKISFLHGMGILSYELFRSAKENCVNVNPNEVQCVKDRQAITELTSALNPVQILEPFCDSGNPDLVTKSKHRILLEENPRDNILSSTLDDDGFECRSYSYKLLYYWANSDEVQRALNIRKGTVEEWVRCNKDKLRYTENVKSTISYHQNLNTRHYRSLIYSGDHDMVVPFTGTQIWIRSLNHTIREDWRPWYVHGQVAGYTREYTSNMTYATIKVSNIIFVDSPVGTGFSYSKTLRGSHSSDKKSAKHTKIFITKWLDRHPEFLRNPFYVGGDSYSGITIPIVVQEISDGIVDGHKPWINLKGYFLGNPITDRDTGAKISFLHGMGILSYELFWSAKENCVNVNPNEVQCAKDRQAITELTSALNPVQILEPFCDSGNPDLVTKSKHRSLLEENPRDNILSSTLDDDGFECRSYSYKLLYYWANSDEVQRALNIRKGTVEEWVRCNKDKLRYTENVKSTISYHQNLNTRHYRSLIYSGDHDMVVPFTGTQIWIRSLNHTIREDWRPWYVHGQVAGYTREYTSNMTYATIKGGAHTAPEYKPKESLAMFKRWISYRSL